MKTLKNLLFVLCSLSVFSYSHADSKVVKFSADEWCPYNCAASSARQGYIIEIATAIFSKAGYKVEYSITPYQRALYGALDGHIDAVPGMDPDSQAEAEASYLKINGKEARFVVSKKVGESISYFYVPANSKWTFNLSQADKDLKALKGNVGAAKGYNYEIAPKLEELDMFTEVGGDAPLESLLKMLDKGEVAAVLDDGLVIQEVAATQGFKGKFKAAGMAGEPLAIHIGFSPKRKELGAIFDKGIDEMRKNGELEKILKKYNIKDWQ